MRNLENYFWDYYHASKGLFGNSERLSYIRNGLKKEFPDLLERFFDNSNKKFMFWTEDLFFKRN